MMGWITGQGGSLWATEFIYIVSWRVEVEDVGEETCTTIYPG
jgi:hypothetical protein